MDWSDESFRNNGEMCPFDTNAMNCDEHLCNRDWYSCGDGQCIEWYVRTAFQRHLKTNQECFNKRHLNYMCEASPHWRAWTTENGLCWPDKGYDDPRYPPWNMSNISNLTANEKCQYLFRCSFSDGLERDCPCNLHNCTMMMIDVCASDDFHVVYPPKGLINPHTTFYYNYKQFFQSPHYERVDFAGNIRCRGYHLTSNRTLFLPFQIGVFAKPRINHFLCTFLPPDDSNHNIDSSFQYDRFCWNESLTFSGRPYAVVPDICGRGDECMSQYRINDGHSDCLENQDEDFVSETLNYCTGNVGRHRFQCFNSSNRSLPLIYVGSATSHCLNNYDEIWYDSDVPLGSLIKCTKNLPTECNRLKTYIQLSSAKNSSADMIALAYAREKVPSDQIPFRSFCNSFWDLKDHIDESANLCEDWVCRVDQYQCQTGQCIHFDWLCDGEWDCSDASDEEALVIIKKWSIHNARLAGLRDKIEKCQKRYFQAPFSKFCNTSYEFGCYRSGVFDPLNIWLNRPCINLTQIGDGIENCYNAYDEKNTFQITPFSLDMWGFNFNCANFTARQPYVCQPPLRDNCTKVLCSNLRTDNVYCSQNADVVCLHDNACKKNVRCDGKPDCFHGEDEYWCASGSFINQLVYRSDKGFIDLDSLQSLFLPVFPLVNASSLNEIQASDLEIPDQNGRLFIAHSYQCNRGVAVLEKNQTVCLCPPAYYGHWCEFFSDRVTIIARVDRKTLPKRLGNSTLKVRANLFFSNQIIDHHEFDVVPQLEMMEKMKHKFYLLYSRSSDMLTQKRNRYFNRTNVMNYHPYSIHFDVFCIQMNKSVQELGSWHHLIYFDYLPVFRVAVVLEFPSWFDNSTLDLCSSIKCNSNSTCMPVFNQNNSYYCSCNNGYFGRDCERYEHHCETFCSENSFCRRDESHLQSKQNHLYCICPLDRFGPHCHLKYDACESNPCFHNGTCTHTYDKSGETPYICICSKDFYGKQCQDGSATVRIQLNMTSINAVGAAVVQFYEIELPRIELHLRHQQVYNELPATIHYVHADTIAPSLGILKTYEDLMNPQYFIIYLLSQPIIDISSSPHYCPRVSSLLPTSNLFFA